MGLWPEFWARAAVSERLALGWGWWLAALSSRAAVAPTSLYNFCCPRVQLCINKHSPGEKKGAPGPPLCSRGRNKCAALPDNVLLITGFVMLALCDRVKPEGITAFFISLFLN